MRRLRDWLHEQLRQPTWLVVGCAALLLLALTFGSRLGGEFVWDDVPLVLENPSLTAPGGLTRLLTHDLWGSAGQASTQLYHPLPMFTFWLQARTHGLGLSGLRLVNVLLHGGCGLLFLALLQRLRVGVSAALLVATLFLLHPLVTEPVMWLTGRHDTLATLATLAALLVFPAPQAARSGWRACASGVLCAAAFASKEPYVVAPALVALLSLVERAPATRIARLVPLWLPAFFGTLGVVGLRMLLHIPTGSRQLGAPPVQLAQSYASIVWHYLTLGLTLDQGATIASYRPLSGQAALAVWLGLLGMFAALVGWARARPGQAHARTAAFGYVWFLGSLSPHVLSLPLLGLWANRYGYFPLLGLLLLLAGGVAALQAHPLALARRALPVLIAVCAALALLQTHAAAALWQDDLTLYAASVVADPTDGRALYHYAHAVRKRDGCRAAVPLLARASQLDPRYPRSQRNLAGCLLDLNEAALAVVPATRAVELEPMVAAHHYNLGAALALSGQRDRGVAELHRALQLEPTHAAARKLLTRLQVP
jgi:tetratricopeptide (TPR) repeat protein